MNHLKPQIHIRTTMIYSQAKLKGSLSKNPLIDHFLKNRCNDLTQQNLSKELSFGQNKNLKKFHSFDLENIFSS